MRKSHTEIWLRLQKGIKQRGLGGSIFHWAAHPQAYLKAFLRARSQVRHDPEIIFQDEFDRFFGVETLTPVHRTGMGIKSKDLMFFTSYGTISADKFHRAMRSLEIDFSSYTFIDFGSGKGRIVMLASDYPFAAIIGLEVSPRLHAIARRNLEVYRNPLQRCSKIDLIETDFRAYHPPDGPLFCFMYNPCEEKLMAGVIEKITASIKELPRSVCVMYFNPRFGTLWENAGFRKISEGGEPGGVHHYRFYSWMPKPALQ